MKHLIVIISVLLAQTAFAQRFELQTYKPSKDIQNEVHEWDDRNICGGYSIGSLWKDSGLTKPYLSLIREADRYLLRVDLSSAGGVYVTGIDQHPFANFEDAEGNVMSLRCDPLTPVVALVSERTISGSSPIIGSTWYSDSRGSTTGISAPRIKMGTYTTILSYVIPDIEEFARHQFVKVSMCDGAIEYDLREGGTKIVNKFNKNLQKAVKHVTKLPSKIRYEEGWHAADSRFSFVPGTSTYTP